MNPILQGRHRDNAVMHSIEQCGALSTQQIRVLHFTNFKSAEIAERKAEDRLKTLSGRGKLIRWKVKGDNGYRYSIEEKQSEHKVMLNWVRIWFVKRLKSWERLHCFAYEQDYGHVKPDALACVKNTVTGQMRFWFVEMERHSDKNKFNKIPKYIKLFKEVYHGKKEYWWCKVAENYPDLLIVCLTEARRKEILSHIAEENKIDLPGVPEDKRKLHIKVMMLQELVDEIK